MNKEKSYFNLKKVFGKKKQAGTALFLSLLFLGAVSCSPDSREEDQDVAEDINTELETSDWPAREGQSEWEEKNNDPVAFTSDELFSNFDEDADQRISYEEFTAAVERDDYSVGWESKNFKELERNEGPFTDYDKNEDGFLDGTEFKDLVTSLGEDVDDPEE